MAGIIISRKYLIFLKFVTIFSTLIVSVYITAFKAPTTPLRTILPRVKRRPTWWRPGPSLRRTATARCQYGSGGRTCLHCGQNSTLLVPIFKEITRLPVGFVSIVFGSNLRWYAINPCDATIGINAYNPFQGLHKCHRETTECQYQAIPEEETGFDLASYRCVCKVGYEYPFNSIKNYFEGAIIEREYGKMLRGEVNAYENMQCRPINQQLEPRYHTSDSVKNKSIFFP